jgi:hypothetical protein
MVGIAALAAPVFGSNVMPDFSSLAGWTTDRYAPASFANIGTQFGYDNVLGIGISSAQGFTQRTSPYQSTFYSTQGDQYQVAGGPGDDVSVQLYVPGSWSNAANGTERTDVWTDTTGQNDFGIIGFTNYGGAARFRVWDGAGVGWIDVAAAVNYDQWNLLDIKYTGTGFDYYINGALVQSLTDAPTPGLALQSVFLEAYNFYGDPAVAGANPVDYTANYANAPEPSSLVMMGAGILGLAGIIRRRRSRG